MYVGFAMRYLRLIIIFRDIAGVCRRLLPERLRANLRLQFDGLCSRRHSEFLRLWVHLRWGIWKLVQWKLR